LNSFLVGTDIGSITWGIKGIELAMIYITWLIVVFLTVDIKIITLWRIFIERFVKFFLLQNWILWVCFKELHILCSSFLLLFHFEYLLRHYRLLSIELSLITILIALGIDWLRILIRFILSVTARVWLRFLYAFNVKILIFKLHLRRVRDIMVDSTVIHWDSLRFNSSLSYYIQFRHIIERNWRIENFASFDRMIDIQVAWLHSLFCHISHLLLVLFIILLFKSTELFMLSLYSSEIRFVQIRHQILALKHLPRFILFSRRS
jgi:hypothetical protein